MTVAGGPPRIRILCLHSFRTSGRIFKEQLQRAHLIEALSDLVDLVFVDAPHPASGPIPRDVKPYFEGPYFEWFTVESMGDRVEFDEAKLEVSERFLVQQLEEHGPFDGVMGFSQGSVMSSAMLALQLAGQLQNPDRAALPPIRFCILFAGLKSRHPRHQAAFESFPGGKLPCPSLHVYGDKDALKNPHCVELADSFQASTVLLHQRGHVIPALQGVHLAVMRTFIQTAVAAPTQEPQQQLLLQPTLAMLPAERQRPGPQAQGATERAAAGGGGARVLLSMPASRL